MNREGLATLLNPVPETASGPPRTAAFAEAKAPLCQDCGARGHCLPVSLDDDALQALYAAFGEPVRVARRAALYRAGDPFQALYAIRVGTLKTLDRKSTRLNSSQRL